MAKPRSFTTLPTRAVADTRLSALDLRTLAVISLHDGMSLMKGKGMGCYAKLSTLAALVHTDISNLSKSLSRLIKLRYILKEPQQGDRRRHTLRVIFEDDCWRNDQSSEPWNDDENVGEIANIPARGNVGEIAKHRSDIVGEETNYHREIVGEPEYLTGWIHEEKPEHYIPLNGEIDFEESREINSDETAHLAFCETRHVREDSPDSGRNGFKKDGAEAPAASGVSIIGQLARSFPRLPVAAKLIRFEEAFEAIDRNTGALAARERRLWTAWLDETAEKFAGEAVGHHAQRLLEEVGLC